MKIPRDMKARTNEDFFFLHGLVRYVSWEPRCIIEKETVESICKETHPVWRFQSRMRQDLRELL